MAELGLTMAYSDYACAYGYFSAPRIAIFRFPAYLTADNPDAQVPYLGVPYVLITLTCSASLACVTYTPGDCRAPFNSFAF